MSREKTTGKEEVFLPEEWSDWCLKEKIGQGSFGSVYRAENREGKSFAIKIMEIRGDSFEVEALERLKGCPYIVAVEDYRIQKTGKADGSYIFGWNF